MSVSPKSALLGLLLVAGCPAPKGGGGSGSPPTLENLGTAYVAAFCAYESRCGLIPDQTFCESSMSAAMSGQSGFNSFPATIAAAQAGKSQFNATAASQCLNYLAAMPCTESLSSTPAACVSMFTGTVAAGGNCITDTECVSGDLCNQADGGTGCAGTCGALPAGACTSSSQCAGGQVCDSNTNQCITPLPAGAAGQPCGTNPTCQSGLYCGESENGSSYSCQPMGASGAACIPSFGSGGNSCGTGLICVPSSDLSSATCMAPATLGQPCTTLYQCGGSESTLICGSSKTCVALPSSGPCIQGNCNMIYAYCDTTASPPTCTPYTAVGGSCAPGSQETCNSFAGDQCEVVTDGGTTGTCVGQPAVVCTP